MTRIHIHEVVTRDDFQMGPEFIPTDAKVAMVDARSCCGFAKIEVKAFTSPEAIPMLRDCEEVVGQIRRVPGVQYTVPVPNLRGGERAMASRTDELNMVITTSESHNLANLRLSWIQSLSALSDTIRVVSGSTAINISLSTAFSCPILGLVAQAAVLAHAAPMRMLHL
jgi:hydroxymethylglutaryl-CoA lyase